MWAGLLIQGSIKGAKGLAKTRKYSLFLVFRDFVRFPVVTGIGDEGVGYLKYNLLLQSLHKSRFCEQNLTHF